MTQSSVQALATFPVEPGESRLVLPGLETTSVLTLVSGSEPVESVIIDPNPTVSADEVVFE